MSMILDDIWFVVFFTTYFLTLPVITLATVTVNPFSKEEGDGGWWHTYTRALKAKGSPLREPFAIPAWLYLLLHVIVMVLMTVPVYTIFHNAGANDGWSSRPIPLMFAMGTHVLYSFWLTVHVATKGNSNVLFQQVLTIGSALIALITMVVDSDLGWMALPYLIWQIVFTAKLAVEHHYTYEKLATE